MRTLVHGTPQINLNRGGAPTPSTMDGTRTAELGSRGLMARSMMLIFAAGASITALSLALTNASHVDYLRLTTTTASGYGVALVLFVVHDRMPAWPFPLLLGLATVLVEWSIYASGDTTSPYAMFYFWIAIYAFYFFAPAVALGELGFIALSYAAVLTLINDLSSPAVTRWAITTSALVVAGAMIGGLKGRIDRLVAQLRMATRRDGVSGLFNQTAFLEQLELDLALMHRSQAPLSILVARLDHLEELRQQQGTASVDVVVRRLAEAFSEHARPSDSVGRVADDAFAVIAPHADQHIGYVLAERLERATRAAVHDPLSVNFGVATYPGDADNCDALLRAAAAAAELALSAAATHVASYTNGR